MSYPYKFAPGIASGLGTGAERFALLPPSATPIFDGFMTRRYMVRGQLNPQAPAYNRFQQYGPQVSLQGNGQALQGQLDLQALSQLTNGSKK